MLSPVRCLNVIIRDVAKQWEVPQNILRGPVNGRVNYRELERLARYEVMGKMETLGFPPPVIAAVMGVHRNSVYLGLRVRAEMQAKQRQVLTAGPHTGNGA